MAHLHSSRSRPEPLALHQSNSTNSHTNPNDRARLLSSLRSAPVPQNYNHQFQSQQQAQQHAQQHVQYANTLPMQQADPRSAAYAQFQNAQTAYLAELQRQIMVKQNEIWINQQQIEAEAAMRAMSLSQQENEREREWNVEMERQNSIEREEEQQARSNPLVASALARRKRQSLNLGPQQQQQQQQQVQSQTPPSFLPHERHSTPPTTCSPPPSSSSSSVRSTPPPPAVILSAPGEPYPDTSSASGSESGDGTRPSSPSTHSGPDSTESSPKLDDSKGGKELKANRRRSHLDTLSNALGGRTKRRPVSMGGPPQSQSFVSPEIVTRPNQLTFAHPSSPNPTRSPRTGYTPRSVSDSHPLLRSPIPSSPQQGSQFASSSHVSVKPPTLPGHAYATRQPKGPPTNLLEQGDSSQGGGAKNFGTRIRQKAILDLKNGLGRGRGRQSSLEVGGARVGVAC